MKELRKFSDVGFEYVHFPRRRYQFDLNAFLHREAKKQVLEQLDILQAKGKCFKLGLEVQVKFQKLTDPTIETLPWFKSANMICLYTRSEWRRVVTEALNKIETCAFNYLTEGSDWTFHGIQEFRAKIAIFLPLSGSCYTYLPLAVRRKRAVGIITTRESKDHRCFLHAVAACIDHHKHPELYKGTMFADIEHLEKIEVQLDESNLSYPTTVSQIAGFERRNGHLTVNVFGWSSSRHKETPLNIVYKSKNTNSQIYVDLLYHSAHFFPIFRLSAMVRLNRGNQKRYVCRSCLFLCSDPSAYKTHKHFCDNKGIIYAPSVEKFLKFHYYKSLCASEHVIYFDIESMLVPASHLHHENPSTMKRVAEHVAMAVAAKRVCVNSALNSKLFYHVGIDCIQEFLGWLLEQKHVVEESRDIHYKPLIITVEDERRVRATKRCDFCLSKFPLDGSGKYRDHCHLRGGRVRAVLCNVCNLNRSDYSKQIQILSHNGTNYDHKFILRGIARFINKNSLQNMRFKVLPKNEEKHSIIFFGPFTFIDSYQFLSESLDSLVSSKRHDDNLARHFPEIAEFVSYDPSKLQLLTRKGKFPFEYVDSMEKLQERQLPRLEAFYDTLKQKDISQEDYQHCHRVFEAFECRNLEDYMLIYLQSDVLLLSSVFEAYRKLSMQKLSMDPVKFFSASHFTFQCMLRYTGVEIEIMQDMEMVNMIKQSIRGGLSLTSKRYLEANEPRMKQYDASKPRVEIAYLDCCNLYGYALKQCLPHKDFRWLTREEIALMDVRGVEDDAETGYILECDFEFPERVHDHLKDFVPLVDKMAVAPANWSPYMKDVFAKTCKAPKVEPEKLTSHLGPRRHYVVHYTHLKLCLALGVLLKRIHRVLAFTQSAYMAPYIDECTKQRQQATNLFESNYWKHQVCSVYGKTVEDLTKRVNMSMVTTSKQFLRASRKMNFQKFNIYGPDFAGVIMGRKIIYMNKPIQVGHAVLEIAKTHMTRFYHLFLKRKLGDDVTLAYTDTDSLIIEVRNQAESFANFMLRHKKHFDLSNFPQDSVFYWDKNKRVPGKFKNECPDQVITNFVALRSKVYCIKFEDDDRSDEIRLKGMPGVITQKLVYADYYDTLFQNEEPEVHSYHAIRSKKQNLYTVKETKVGLSCWDSKRYILPDGFTTLPYFHKDTLTL